MQNDEPDFSKAPKTNPTLKAKSVPEKNVEKAFCDLIKRYGGIAYKFTSPNRRSVPDRLCVMPNGFVFFAEIKSAKGVLTELQAREIATLEGMGVFVIVVRGPDDLPGVADMLKSRYGI
jgi:hypothetical protein